MTGAKVEFESDLLPAQRVAKTDAGGRFWFAGLRPGHYPVSAWGLHLRK
jgi:protocatechuate 3,4-dioxygenase beta subunit